MIYHLEELLKTAKIKPAINQIELSPAWQQKEVVEFCKKNDILLQAWQPIAPFRRGWILQKEFIQQMPKNIIKHWHKFFLIGLYKMVIFLFVKRQKRIE